MNCFAALNVNGKYNIILASIDKNAVANTDLINSHIFDNINDYKYKANQLVQDWYNS